MTAAAAAIEDVKMLLSYHATAGSRTPLTGQPGRGSHKYCAFALTESTGCTPRDRATVSAQAQMYSGRIVEDAPIRVLVRMIYWSSCAQHCSASNEDAPGSAARTPRDCATVVSAGVGVLRKDGRGRASQSTRDDKKLELMHSRCWTITIHLAATHARLTKFPWVRVSGPSEYILRRFLQK